MIVTSEPSSKDVQFLEDQINEHNVMRTGRRDFQPLGVFVGGDDGSIIAGLYVSPRWTLEVKFVWVREDLRGRGHGRRMLEAAGAEARKRGCEHVWLDSYTFQAPTFYRQFGYQAFGSLDG